MKVLNCIWEIRNIGKKTVEVIIDSTDIFDAGVIEDVIHDYEYIVVKLPVNKVEYNIELSKLGLSFIETQFHISKTNDTFNYNDKLVTLLSRNLSFSKVEDDEHLEDVISKITPNMFSTDRVFLDPLLGPEYSCNRYKNWIRSSYSCGSIMYELNIKGKDVGFSLINRQSNGTFDYILGGVYEMYKNCGYGLLTPASPFLYCRDNRIECAKVDTHISSNNLPVVKLYNYLGYAVNDLFYVYIKHN